MSPITHFLAGWVLFERPLPSVRDKALVVFAGLAPDLDGLGIVIDFATRTLGLPETNYYQQFHRIYGHGILAAVLFALLVGVLAERKRVAAALALANFHLHLLCDLVGSRGAEAEDIWGVYYLAPFSTAHELTWSGQWPLVGWQNTLITALLLLAIMRRAAIRGYSPVGMFSRKADGEFVEILRKWRRALSGG